MSQASIFVPLERPGRAGNAARVRVATLSAAALLGASVLGGCASEPKPTAQLVRASTLVSQAEKSQAQRYAPTDLQRARDELSSARSAEADGKYDRALRLAENAAADADLAGARAAEGKAKESAGQVHRSLDTLREQLQQNPAPSGNTGPGTSGPGQDHL
jgi:tetratricopeptide (TPR) repeat protein